MFRTRVTIRFVEFRSVGADPAVDGIRREGRHLGRSGASATTYDQRYSTADGHPQRSVLPSYCAVHRRRRRAGAGETLPLKKKKNREKYYFGQLSCKIRIRAFSRKYNAKMRTFCLLFIHKFGAEMSIAQS